MKRSTNAALNACIELRSKSNKFQKGDKVTSDCKADNYLLEKYAREDDIADTKADMLPFIQAQSIWPPGYTQASWNKALRCHREYEEYVVKGIFIEELSESIQHSMRLYMGSETNATIHYLGRYRTLWTEWQIDSQNNNVPLHNEMTKNPMWKQWIQKDQSK